MLYFLAFDYGNKTNARLDFVEDPHGDSQGNYQVVLYASPHMDKCPTDYHEKHPNFYKQKKVDAHFQFLRNTLLLPKACLSDPSKKETALLVGLYNDTALEEINNTLDELNRVTNISFSFAQLFLKPSFLALLNRKKFSFSL